MKKNKTTNSLNGTVAVVYARYSPGPNQTEQSIEGQIHDCQKYAAEHGITIIDYYCDRHVSGKEDFNRGEFQRMLRDSEKNLFNCVLTWKVDRFGRNREEIAMNKARLKKNGVKLVYAKESIPDGPEGIILESVLEGLAEYYSADLSQKVKRGMTESAMKGHVLGSACVYGFRKADDKTYAINEQAAPIVQEIFKKYADGDIVPDIVKDLTSRGIYTYKEKPFDTSTIYRMLRNRKYIGEYTYAGVSYEGGIPRIISDELWERVQIRLEQNERRAGKFKSNVKFLLSGKLICAECGQTYSGESGTGKHGEVHRYYKCHGKKTKKTSCSSANFRKEWLEQFVLFHTRYDILTDDMIEYLANEVMKVHEKESSSYLLNSYRKELKDVEKALHNIMKAIEQGIFNDTTAARMQELEGRKNELKLLAAKEELKRVPLTKEHLVYWFEKFRSGDINAEYFQQQLVDVFINQIFIYKDKMVIAYNFTSNNHSIGLSDIPDGVRIHLQKVGRILLEPFPVMPLSPYLSLFLYLQIQICANCLYMITLLCTCLFFLFLCCVKNHLHIVIIKVNFSVFGIFQFL